MRVLIAHTDEAARTMLAEALDGRHAQPRDVDVVFASEGSDALDLLLHDDPPEVALIDWDLSGIEGPEMCRLVRDFRHGRATWIVVLAGPGHADTADAWRAGARDCVAMPAPAAAVADAVAKGLRETAPESGPEAQPECNRETPPAPHGAPAAPERAARAPRPAFDAVCALDAVCSPDGEIRDDGFAGLTADLAATLSADGDDEGPAKLAAGPVRLCAQRVDLDDGVAARRGPATLDALLARL